MATSKMLRIAGTAALGKLHCSDKRIMIWSEDRHQTPHTPTLNHINSLA